MRLPAFLTQMDKKALRAVVILLLMFVMVVGIVVYSKTHIDLNESVIGERLAALQNSGFALPVTVLLFCVAAFISVPQWVLIAVSVAAFGPVTGGFYAWIATMVSASFNFGLARVIGAAQLERLSGGFVNRITHLIRRNAVLTSFAVRLVPTGPFVVVNMAAGVSGMRYVHFALGTALGILPKILIVVFLGQGVLSAEQGRAFMIGSIAAAITLIVVMLSARRYLRRFMTEPIKTAKLDEKL